MDSEKQLHIQGGSFLSFGVKCSTRKLENVPVIISQSLSRLYKWFNGVLKAHVILYISVSAQKHKVVLHLEIGQAQGFLTSNINL